MSRLVIYTSGTLGDHLPYLALAQGLQAAGHDLLLVINQAMHPYAARAGVPAVALTDIERGPEEARENAWAWDHWNNPLIGAPAHPKARSQPAEEFVTQVRELAGYLEGADLLLATSIRAQGLAAQLVTGVPWLTLSVNPSAFSLPAGYEQREQAVFGLERAQYEGLRLLIDHTLQALDRPGMPPAWYHGVLWAPHVLLGSSPHFSGPNPEQLQPFSSIDQTGFWFWEDPAWASWEPPPGLEAFMAARPLVLTFSSQPLEQPGQTLRLHVQAAQRLERPLLVQRGWAGFSAADLPPGVDASQVRFIDYAPHDWLFARASCAIQHGGIGSLARALRQDCPVLVEPFGNDQFFNAQRVAELGVGVAAHPFQTTPDQLAELIEKQVLAPATRLRAKRLGRALRAEDGVGQAVALVEEALRRGARPLRSRLWWGMRPLGQPAPAERQEAATVVSATIPRILHQTWKTEEIPPEFQAWAASWREHHPAWEFRLWTDAECRALIARAYPWFLDVYDRYPEPIMRVDAARYFILHHEGGVYADLDYEALRPLDPLLEGRQLLLTTEPPAHMATFVAHSNRLNTLLCNALMASAPGHPFWEHLFDLLAAWQVAAEPLDATGPFLLSRAYESYAMPQQVTIESYLRLCPISSHEPWLALPPQTQALIGREAFALHHWYGSWHHDPPLQSGPLRADLLLHGRLQPAAFQVTRAQLAQAALELPAPPLISCLMVTRERTLLAQLAVHSFQMQTYTARELIIIDDGPDDVLQTWVAGLDDERIRFLRLPDEGQALGALRNTALEAARGAFVAQWDDDDYAAPERLAVQVGALQLYRVEACLLSRQMIWMPQLGFLGKSARRLWEGSALLPRTAVPPYPTERRGEDTPVVQQVVARAPTVLIDAPELYLYLFHGANTFDAAHWQQQMQAATMRYTHYRYAPALRELERYLQVELERLGTHLRGVGVPTTAAAAVAPPPTPSTAEPDAPDPLPGRAASLAPHPLPPPLPGPRDSWPRVLILTPVKDAAAHLPRYLANLQALDYPPQKVSLAFLESDSRDGSYELLEQALPELQAKLRRVMLLRRDFGLQIDGARWEQALQLQRRATIARSRNTLLQAALADEAWVLWIDADVAQWPADVIQQLLGAGKQIVVPNCLAADGERPFDLNTFKLQPGAEQLDWSRYMVDGLLQPPAGFGRDYLTDLRDRDLVELDGVGGTMLLVKAVLHRDGLVFPPYSYRGFIDTEGLAVMARDMGVQPWGLPNLIIRHS